jgi:hypothetical protein
MGIIVFCRVEGQTENFTPSPGDNFTTRRQTSLLGDKVPYGGQSLPLGAKLRMGLCSLPGHGLGDGGGAHAGGVLGVGALRRAGLVRLGMVLVQLSFS